MPGRTKGKVKAITEALIQEEFARWRKRFDSDEVAAYEGFKAARGLHMQLKETQARMENYLAEAAKEANTKPLQALNISLAEMLVVLETMAPSMIQAMPAADEKLLAKRVTMFKREKPGPDQNAETFKPGIYFVPVDSDAESAYRASS